MWEYSKHIAQTSSGKKHNLIVMGDSRIKAAFIPDQTNDETINLSVPGASPIDTFYTLKKYLINNVPPDNLVISFSPFHFMEADCFWGRSVRYKFLNNNEYDEVKVNSIKFQDDVLGEFHKWKYNIIPGVYLTSIVNGIKKKRWNLYNDTYNTISERKGHYFLGRENGSSEPNQEVGYKIFQPSKLLDYYVNETIALAKKNNIKLYWYTTPFNKASCELLASGFKEKYEDHIDDYGKKGVIIINKLTCLDNKLFGDSSHVYSGAEQITNEIINFIK